MWAGKAHVELPCSRGSVPKITLAFEGQRRRGLFSYNPAPISLLSSKPVLKLALALCCSALIAGAVRQKSRSAAARDAASIIIAMERAALDRSAKGDPDGFLEISDPDVTYFDPCLESPIYSLKELTAYYHKNLTGDRLDSGEFLTPKVQLSGDTAVLTFNYNSRAKGKVTRWHTTPPHARRLAHHPHALVVASAPGGAAMTASRPGDTLPTENW